MPEGGREWTNPEGTGPGWPMWKQYYKGVCTPKASIIGVMGHHEKMVSVPVIKMNCTVTKEEGID